MRPLILLPLLLASAPAWACEVDEVWPADGQVVPTELIVTFWRGRDCYVEVYTLDNDGRHIELVAAPPNDWGSAHTVGMPDGLRGPIEMLFKEYDRQPNDEAVHTSRFTLSEDVDWADEATLHLLDIQVERSGLEFRPTYRFTYDGPAGEPLTSGFNFAVSTGDPDTVYEMSDVMRRWSDPCLAVSRAASWTQKPIRSNEICVQQMIGCTSAPVRLSPLLLLVGLLARRRRGERGAVRSSPTPET